MLKPNFSQPIPRKGGKRYYYAFHPTCMVQVILTIMEIHRKLAEGEVAKYSLQAYGLQFCDEIPPELLANLDHDGYTKLPIVAKDDENWFVLQMQKPTFGHFAFQVFTGNKIEEHIFLVQATQF